MAQDARLLVRFGHGGAGVALHVPMFLMGRKTGYRLVGMPMGTGMLVGMALIILGVAAAAYGLLPSRRHEPVSYASIAPPEDAPLTKAHWIQIGLLAVALIIDVMKAATLGFVTPGMRAEYGLSFSAVAVLPFVALTRHHCGVIHLGRAGRYLRPPRRDSARRRPVRGHFDMWRDAILRLEYLHVLHDGTRRRGHAACRQCASRRDHADQAPRLVPGAPRRHRHDRRVLCHQRASALLQPHFGWRIMWLIGFPTGLILVVLSPLLPESARFLMEMGRADEAREMLARYGAVIMTSRAAIRHRTKLRRSAIPTASQPGARPSLRPLLGLSFALTLAALAWGFVNFGVLLWLPSSLIAGAAASASQALLLRGQH